MKHPIWIDTYEALIYHDRMLSLHGGAPGLRDEGLLQSAMARPRQRAAYEEDADLVPLAAAYTVAIVRNHPFVDGNKRTGFLVGVLFLELNGYRFTARQEDAANAVQALACGDLDEEAYAGFLAANVVVV